MSKIARIPVSNLPPGVPGLVRWIKRTHPVVYRALDSKVRAVAAMHGLGVADPNAAPGTAIAAADTPGWGATILNTVKELLPTAISTYQQKKVFDLQLRQAAAGKPPLDINALSDASALRLGVDSSTRNTGLIIAGVGAAALLGFALLRR